MKIQLYEKLTDIPGIERFYDNMSVFASQEFANYLKNTKNYSTFWFHGVAESDIQFILPLAVRKKYIFKNGMFLTATISLDYNIDTEIEREFLDGIIEIIRQKKLCDWIGQPPNWAIFNVVPKYSIYCEFGSYRIDLLNNNEDELYAKVNYHHKRLINKSVKNNITIKNSPDLLEDCSNVFMDASAHGNHTLPTKNEIKEILKHLPGNLNIYVSYNESNPQSSIICFTNKFCVYATYIGKISDSSAGENHLLHWQAIKDAKQKGVKYFDFIGARINPIPGSKQEGIQKFKKYFGGEFIKGFLWKIPISNTKYHLHNLLIKSTYFIKFKKYAGDIIDQELRRTKE